MVAQTFCGDLYDFGDGVAKDDRLAFVYNEKAAQQGQPGSTIGRMHGDKKLKSPAIIAPVYVMSNI